MITPQSATALKCPALVEGALAMLKAEHDAVSHLFAEFAQTRSAPRKARISCPFFALNVNAYIEDT